MAEEVESAEPKMVEKRISFEGFQIKCDKCPGELLSMKSNTNTVTIAREPIVTKVDLIALSNIPAFKSCSGSPTGTCTPIFTQWIDVAEPTVNSEKFIPLVEHSELICTKGGGLVAFEPPTAQSEKVGPKKPNIIDKAKAKINGLVNKVSDLAKQATEGVTNQMSAAFDGLKPIGQIFDNSSVQSAVSGAQNLLDQANLAKGEVDKQLENLENAVPNIKNKIQTTIDGIEVPTLNDFGVSEDTSDLSSEDQAFIQQGIMGSVTELESYFNNEINTASLIGLDENSTGNMSVPIMDDRTPLERWKDQKDKEKENIENIATTEYNIMVEDVTSINKDVVFDGGEDSKEALSLLYNLYIPSQAGVIPPAPEEGEVLSILTDKAKDKIQDELNNEIDSAKNKLNTNIQNEFDEALKELGYDEAQAEIDELQEESAELQEDLDKAEKWLGRMSDYDGFINGLKGKYISKITDKYDEVLGKATSNLASLNTSLDGLGYVVDGMPAGDVVTWVKAKKEDSEENKDDENGEGGTTGTGIGASNDKEPSLKAYWGSPR